MGLYDRDYMREPRETERDDEPGRPGCGALIAIIVAAIFLLSIFF